MEQKHNDCKMETKNILPFMPWREYKTEDIAIFFQTMYIVFAYVYEREGVEWLLDKKSE